MLQKDLQRKKKNLTFLTRVILTRVSAHVLTQIPCQWLYVAWSRAFT